MNTENHGNVALIQTEGLIPQDIEYAVLAALAHGRRAAVGEAAIKKMLRRAGARTMAVTEWANEFAACYEIRWERRRLCGDLLFSSSRLDASDGAA